ncbi:hypothetical protein BAST_1635 [Bifidobacterium asteroides PRL2011]|nr:hypothetical protein BAST_1635 [Bifidobacterium asteroides PRL2011]
MIKPMRWVSSRCHRVLCVLRLPVAGIGPLVTKGMVKLVLSVSTIFSMQLTVLPCGRFLLHGRLSVLALSLLQLPMAWRRPCSLWIRQIWRFMWIIPAPCFVRIDGSSSHPHFLVRCSPTWIVILLHCDESAVSHIGLSGTYSDSRIYGQRHCGWWFHPLDDDGRRFVSMTWKYGMASVSAVSVRIISPSSQAD